MSIYVIHGPTGCGKTLNIPAFEQWLGVPFLKDLDLVPAKAAVWVTSLGVKDGFVLTNLPESDLAAVRNFVRAVIPYADAIDACRHSLIPVTTPTDLPKSVLSKRTLGHIGDPIPEVAAKPFAPYCVLDRMELAAWLNSKADKLAIALDGVLFEHKGNVVYLTNVIAAYRAEAKRLLDIPAEE